MATQESLAQQSLQMESADHANNQALASILLSLEDEAVEIDEIVVLLKRSKPLCALVKSAAQTLVQESRSALEVRSLNHAIKLLGLTRLDQILVSQLIEPEHELRKTA